MSRRDEIRMTRDELRAFLEEELTVICASHGVHGWPHLMPLWYVVRDDELWAWTYARSQKVRNIERDPRVTLQVESGTTYDQLRGVMVEATCEIDRDPGRVAQLGAELLGRYGGGVPLEVDDMIRAQAAKRVGLRFRAQRVVTWDHRKLGGGY